MAGVIALAVTIIICLGFVSNLFRTYGLKGILIWIKPAFSTDQRRKKRTTLSEIKDTLENIKRSKEEKQRLLEEKKITALLHNKVVKKIKKMEKQLRKHDFVEIEYSDCSAEIRLPGAGKDQRLLYKIHTYVDYISRTEYAPAFNFRRYSFKPEERKLLEKFQFLDADQSFDEPGKMIKCLNQNLRKDIERFISLKKQNQMR
jgi:hypothetical protein